VFLTALDKVSLWLWAMQPLSLEGSVNLRQPRADQDADKLCFFIREKDLLQLRASMLQHQSTALRAACPRMAAGGAAGGAAGCPGLWCRAGSLLWPRGCVPGQGLCRLPGSALSCPGSCPGQEERQDRDFPFPVLRKGTRVVDSNLKAAVKYEHISENPEMYISHSAVI